MEQYLLRRMACLTEGWTLSAVATRALVIHVPLGRFCQCIPNLLWLPIVFSLYRSWVSVDSFAIAQSRVRMMCRWSQRLTTSKRLSVVLILFVKNCNISQIMASFHISRKPALFPHGKKVPSPCFTKFSSYSHTKVPSRVSKCPVKKHLLVYLLLRGLLLKMSVAFSKYGCALPTNYTLSLVLCSDWILEVLLCSMAWLMLLIVHPTEDVSWTILPMELKWSSYP